jgi:hypothetical protein
MIDRRSPLTVAGAAPVSHRLPIFAPPRMPGAKNLDSMQNRRRGDPVKRYIKKSLYVFRGVVIGPS